MSASPTPARGKPSKTAIIVLSSLLGFVLICTVLNYLGNSGYSFTPGPTAVPTFDQALAQATAAAHVATSFEKWYGNIVNTTSGQAQALDCGKYSGMQFALPGGSSVSVPCPADSATLTSLTPDALPAALDDGVGFVSGMDVQVSPSLSGALSVRFIVPVERKGDLDRMTILHWNGAVWEDLGPGQGLTVQLSAAGVFVLATK